jgi:23S rRNA (cytidine1920-2'-O)/16S rRNA (cytidine1409-2'-O)-methyltransferase
VSKQRLDVFLAKQGLVSSRSQAESYVRLGQVKVNGRVASKSGQMVSEIDKVQLTAEEQYVSRAALKLKSAVETFGLDFTDKTVLDVGSSTGGFTQYALRHGAAKVIAVIKNDKIRREILKDFESWAQEYFKVLQKADSGVAGSKGNIERFYMLHKLS